MKQWIKPEDVSKFMDEWVWEVTDNQKTVSSVEELIAKKVNAIFNHRLADVCELLCGEEED